MLECPQFDDILAPHADLLQDARESMRNLMWHQNQNHDLPIEQGRMARPIVPGYLRRCTLCSRHALGDVRHFMLECPQFDDVRAQYLDLLQNARDSMRN